MMIAASRMAESNYEFKGAVAEVEWFSTPSTYISVVVSNTRFTAKKNALLEASCILVS
jgi:hypothetical protein